MIHWPVATPIMCILLRIPPPKKKIYIYIIYIYYTYTYTPITMAKCCKASPAGNASWRICDQYSCPTGPWCDTFATEGKLQNFPRKTFHGFHFEITLICLCHRWTKHIDLERPFVMSRANAPEVKPMTWKLYIWPFICGNNDHPLPKKIQPDFNPHPHICDTKSFVGNFEAK